MERRLQMMEEYQEEVLHSSKKDFYQKVRVNENLLENCPPPVLLNLKSVPTGIAKDKTAA